jgi:predicted lipoprotein with Yx(FWY)xxD motif
MKKTLTVAAVIVVLVLLAVAAYMIYGNTYKSSSPSSSPSSQNNAPAVNNAVLKTKTDATLGQYLTDPSGKPLYTYDPDTSGQSNCTGSCLSNWPAYQVSGSSANLPTGVGVLKRTDNNQVQYTYYGKPLYYFTSDKKGNVTGNGVESFHVAKPVAASASPSASASSSASVSPAPASPSQMPSSSYPY